jgi:hypothetical protein
LAGPDVGALGLRLILFQLFQHLLPRALAWRTTVDTVLRRFFEGLAVLPTDVRAFADLAYLDLFPETTRELPAWEKQFALSSGGSELTRRLKLATAWSTGGRQSPDYIQRAIHAAGFTSVFIHEWWVIQTPSNGYQCEASSPWQCFEPGPGDPLAPHCALPTAGVVARDPRDYTTQPLVGDYQCESSSPWECFEPAPGDPLPPHCDETLANEPGYIVNLDLTRRAPPPVPDDPSRWPYFLYFSGETFPELAPVDASRVAELKELLLRIAPAQQWLVLLIDPLDEFEGFGSGDFGGAPLGA